MNQETTELLQSRLNEAIVEYLNRNNVIDLIQEISLKLGKKASTLGLKLDYDNLLTIPGRWVDNGINHTAISVYWEMPFRILEKHGAVWENRPSSKIIDSLERIDFEITYDQVTGSPTISLKYIEGKINPRVVSR